LADSSATDAAVTASDQPAAASGKRPPLSLGAKFAYGSGQAAEGLKNAAFGVFLFFYYNQVLALPGTYVGLAIGIALVFDAITDPLVGSLSDNWRSKFGRRHPFMYMAAVPLAIAFYFLFTPPEGLSSFSLFLWLLCFAILTRGAMTLYHVPHIALGAELSEDFNERTTIVAFRQFFSTFGALIAYFVGFAIYFYADSEYPRGQFRTGAYSPFALTLAVLMVGSILYSALGTRKHIPYLPKPRGSSEPLGVVAAVVRMLVEMKQALTNHTFAWLFSGVLIVFMMVGVDNALNLHMNTYFWELSSSDNIAFFAATPLGIMFGAFIARALTERFDKKPSVVYGTAWWALCQIVPVVLRLLGWFPENGTDELLYTLVTIKFVQGVGVVQALITFGSMVADIVDEHELNTGKRQEGIFFASVSFSGKFTTGIGNVVGGIALDLISWPRGVAIQTAADVPAETLTWLGLIYGPIVSGFAVVCLYCYSKHRLDRYRHAEIVRELAKRHESEVQSVA